MAEKVKNNFTNKMFSGLWIPAMASSLGLAFGDMADALVIGQKMGATGLAAVSLSLPVYMIINVFMHSLGLGGAAKYSRLLGKGNEEEARQIFNRVMQAAAAVGIILAVSGNLLLTPLLRLLGTTPGDGELFAATETYVRIIIFGIPFFFISYILNYFLRNDNSQKRAAIGFTVANICDIIMNILFVLVLDLGVAGAAWSTVIGQLIAIAIYLPGLRGTEHVLRFKLYHLDMKVAFGCFKNGFSISVQYICQMVFLLIANNVLMRTEGENGVAVFDMLQNVSYLILYLYDGTAKAMQPLVSTYSGEHNEIEKQKTKRLGLFYGSLAGGTAIMLVMLFPGAMCRLFGLHSPENVALGAFALRLYGVGAFFAGISIILSGFSQASEAVRDAFIMASLRGAVVLIPCTIIFSAMGGFGFWFLFPATELISLLLFLLWRHFYGQRTTYQEDRVYTCNMENKNRDLEEVLAETETFCERWQASPRQIYFVRMTVEEVCLAIISQAFSRGENGYIQVTLVSLKNGEFELHIRDNAKKFNPFEMGRERAETMDDYDMNAMGMLVIKKKAKSFYYRQYQGFNTLIVKI